MEPQQTKDLITEITVMKELIADLESRLMSLQQSQQTQTMRVMSQPTTGNIKLSSFIQQEFGDIELEDCLYTKQRLLQIMRLYNPKAVTWFMTRYSQQWQVTTTRAHKRAVIEQYLITAFCKYYNLVFIKRAPAPINVEHNDGRHRGYYGRIHVIEAYKNK